MTNIAKEINDTMILPDNLIFNKAEPESVTIIPTYRCNAACKECCFESHSGIKHRMTKEEVFTIIHKIKTELPNVRYVVLTGGEITLLKNDLIEIIHLLTELGLGSRIVTNGHWGRTDESANEWILKLLSAGLGELNLSTGDEHQEWVPFESVARAAYHAVAAGLMTLITVEGQTSAKFNVEKLKDNLHINKIYSDKELTKKFILITNIWMPFHEGAKFTLENSEATYEGCDNIFENFVVNPYGFLMSCCGLTMEYIPELKVGNAYQDSLKEIYQNQYNDLLKLWIWLDGTRYIFERLSTFHDLKLISQHPCSICAQLYQNKEIKNTLLKLLEENEENIVFRAAIKTRITGRAKLS